MNNYFSKGLINHRESLGFWLNEYGLLGHAVEIGVAKGNFARTVLSQWKGSKYSMIDAHEAQDPEVYREDQPNDWQDWKNHCLKICEEDKRAELITAYSPTAADNFKMGSLDLAYLDSNHAYGHVMSEMDAFWPKVKIGGIMGGHDFLSNTEGGAWIEVDRAVERWAKEHGVVFYVCPCSSWFIHKVTP